VFGEDEGLDFLLELFEGRGGLVHQFIDEMEPLFAEEIPVDVLDLLDLCLEDGFDGVLLAGEDGGHD
jgi:hypothetical protein